MKELQEITVKELVTAIMDNDFKKLWHYSDTAIKTSITVNDKPMNVTLKVIGHTSYFPSELSGTHLIMLPGYIGGADYV